MKKKQLHRMKAALGNLPNGQQFLKSLKRRYNKLPHNARAAFLADLEKTLRLDT